MAPRGFVVLALALAGAGCTLLVDAGGLTGGASLDTGATGDASAPDASAFDASPLDASTASRDAPAADDGGHHSDGTGPGDGGTSAPDAACAPGRSSCNASQGNDIDGCECATAACCPSGCQTIHSNGVGDTYADCQPAGTVDRASALAACTAFANGRADLCSSGWSCGEGEEFVCFSTNGGGSCAAYCWIYSGLGAGAVITCGCPGAAVGRW